MSPGGVISFGKLRVLRWPCSEAVSSRNVGFGMSAIVRPPSAPVVRHWRRTQEIWTKSRHVAKANATLGENTIGEVLHVSD